MNLKSQIHTTHNTLDLSQGRIHADRDQLVIFLDALGCFCSLTTLALGKTPKRNQRMKNIKRNAGRDNWLSQFSSVPVCVVKEMLFVPRLTHENLSDSLNAALYYNTAFFKRGGGGERKCKCAVQPLCFHVLFFFFRFFPFPSSDRLGGTFVLL